MIVEKLQRFAAKRIQAWAKALKFLWFSDTENFIFLNNLKKKTMDVIASSHYSRLTFWK